MFFFCFVCALTTLKLKSVKFHEIHDSYEIWCILLKAIRNVQIYTQIIRILICVNVFIYDMHIKLPNFWNWFVNKQYSQCNNNTSPRTLVTFRSVLLATITLQWEWTIIAQYSKWSFVYTVSVRIVRQKYPKCIGPAQKIV